MSARQLTAAERQRLVALLGMLGSAHDGEVTNAARLAEKFRRQHGMTWEDLLSLRAEPAPAPPPPTPSPKPQPRPQPEAPRHSPPPKPEPPPRPKPSWRPTPPRDGLSWGEAMLPVTIVLAGWTLLAVSPLLLLSPGPQYHPSSPQIIHAPSAAHERAVALHRPDVVRPAPSNYQVLRVTGGSPAR